MKKKTKFGVAGILAATALAASTVAAMAADVDVYAEGAYTASDLVVYIYADINSDPLVSAGVKLTYDKTKFFPLDSATDPAGSAPIATKNEADWYFGAADGTKYPYQDPQIDAAKGEVVFICGKIDESAPTAGVKGAKKLIGKVTLKRLDGDSPGASPETYFGIGLGLGIVRADGEYANFVTTGETVLDNLAGGVDFGNIIIRERGDANIDKSVTPADMITVRNAYYANAPLACWPAADCNADGSVTPADMICIRNKYYAP